MIKELRENFNRKFSDEKYSAFLSDLQEYAGDHIPFRIAETPVFIPDELKLKLLEACNSIIELVSSPLYLEISKHAIPENQFVPGPEGHPMWMAFDFAICRDEKQNLIPQLIELQGFPSLFYYQHVLAKKYRQHFDLPSSVDHLNNKSDEQYEDFMREALLGKHNAENVILLEVEPEKQNTRIDFAATYKHTGIRAVCISKVIKEAEKLYYIHDNRKIAINRIYNRVIFDELLKRTDLHCQFNLTDNADVEWAGHPNWFFRISKFTLPYLKNSFVPETSFLNDLNIIPDDLHNYVLKPLFSFSGTGVIYNVTVRDIQNIKDPQNWILQRKVNYEPVIEGPGGNIKTEIRMLYGWQQNAPEPEFLITLARLSKGEMIGVKYNKDKSWVGSSVAFFEK
jgi:hypothetical protein